MAALSVGSSQVLPTLNDPVSAASPAPRSLPAGRSFFDATTGKWRLAQGDGAVYEAGADGYGISVSQAYTDQPLVVALAGHRVTLGAGAAPAAGVVYYLGDGAGDIVPVADIGTADKVLPLCLGIGSNKVKMEDRGQAGTLGKR
jgi:anti-sigma-K factor RskA